MHPQSRSLAIDVLRGMTLALMIVVNMSIGPGDSYPPLLHADWHGFTLTDSVFPTFLFAVGASMAWTLEKYQRLGDADLLRKVLTRTALIFLCGYLLYWFPFFGTRADGSFGLLPLSHTRIPGVLQRIAVTYGAAALLLTYLKPRTVGVIAVLALLVYWALLAHFGDYTLTGNAALKVDLAVFGPDHLYHGEGIAFDPEGLLSTLPALVNVLAGYFAARYVREGRAGFDTVARLVAVGVICLLLAVAWNTVLPINKKLWTSSYVLCTVGVDLLVYAALVAVIDLLGVRGWTHFFEVFGRNTLFIYLLSEVGNTVLVLTHVGDRSTFLWLWQEAFVPWAGRLNGSLLYSVAYMLCLWLVAYGMDKRRIYIKL